MAKATQTKAAETPKAPTAAAATSTETAQQVAETARAEQAKAEEAKRVEEAEAASSLAEDQRNDLAAGGDGSLPADQAELAKAHTITDPKAAPVDYSVQTLRRPAQRILNPEDTSADAMPRAPVASLPYGSEPRTVDPATGVAPVSDEPAPEGTHGDDEDADTDRGSSAVLREAAAKA